MENDGTKRALRLLWLIVLAAAVRDALRGHRKHGEVFGLVPYDFRMPTVDRARAHSWNPESRRILTPATFGIGWSINLGRLARLAHLA
jgi:Family of unknown function (DUF5808)